MAKGQMRSNREAKKPKANKPAAVAPTAGVLTGLTKGTTNSQPKKKK